MANHSLPAQAAGQGSGPGMPRQMREKMQFGVTGKACEGTNPGRSARSR